MSWPEALATLGAVAFVCGVPGALIAYRMHIVRTCDHDWIQCWERGFEERPIAYRCKKCGVER